jgi:TRAP-type mannitol/chloroaromatic compound transport system substrate-binding protein
MLLTLDNDFEDSQKKGYLNGIAAWLKSSFVLWYITAIYQTDDLFEVLINDKKIPLPKDLKVLVELGSLAEKVSASEVNVLRAVAKERPSEREREKAIATLLKHNKAVQDNMKQIDRTVLRNVSASKQEITEIYRVLRDLDLYDYGISTDLDSFIKEVEEGK